MPQERVRRIFISYRRSDAGGHVGRLAGDLAERFGPLAVFADTKDIGGGHPFRKQITFELGRCAVILVVVGPDYLTVMQPDGKTRRIDDPEDLVRLEVATALAAGDARVVPVLVGGAGVPKRADLPDALAALTDQNARSMRHETWPADFETLAQDLAPALEIAKPLRSMADVIAAAKAALLVAAVLAAAAAVVRAAAPSYSPDRIIMFGAVLLIALAVFFPTAAGKRLLPPRALARLTATLCVVLAVLLSVSVTAYALLNPLSLAAGRPRPPDSCDPLKFAQAFGASHAYTQGPRLCDQKTWCATGLEGDYQEIRVPARAAVRNSKLTVAVPEGNVIEFVQAPLENRDDVPDGFTEKLERPPAAATAVLTFDGANADPVVVRFRVAGSASETRVRAQLSSPLGMPVQEVTREITLGYDVRRLPVCNDAAR
jgi:hypothetical protein